MHNNKNTEKSRDVMKVKEKTKSCTNRDITVLTMLYISNTEHGSKEHCTIQEVVPLAGLFLFPFEGE